MSQAMNPHLLNDLRQVFQDRLQENVSLANYTTARVGGKTDGFIVIHTLDEFEKAVTLLWKMNAPFYVLGSGSNVLVSDNGYHGVILLNHAHTVKVDMNGNPPTVWAESGASLSSMSRQVALWGLSGLEWAASIPGTVGGAVYGNAGAFGSDMSNCLLLAEILHQNHNRETWSCDEFQFSYRSSQLKQLSGIATILSVRLKLVKSSKDQVQALMEENVEKRKRTQPPGASMGCMFKNPPEQHAGRLIESSGMKGVRVGGAEVSSKHANFFVNHENATALDIYKLIRMTQEKVYKNTGIQLEPEIELLGDWQEI